MNDSEKLNYSEKPEVFEISINISVGGEKLSSTRIIRVDDMGREPKDKWLFTISLYPEVSPENEIIVKGPNKEKVIQQVEEVLSSLGIEWDKSIYQNQDNRYGELTLYKNRNKAGRLTWNFLPSAI